MTIVCGIEMPNDLMSPRYSKGDIALCALCEKIEAGHDYIIATSGPRRAGRGAGLLHGCNRVMGTEPRLYLPVIL
jgi:hypothetical protein